MENPERRQTRADKAVRDAAEEIRRETRAAAAEVRLELGAAGRETTEALRDAMAEVRAAFAEVWGPIEDEGAGPSSPPGRMSRAQRKEMTRELLLDAAIEVFAEKGYHGASLDDVADAAGFTKGAVYSNFSRKADLFRALMERETQRRHATLRRAVEAVPVELLPDVAAELLRDPELDQHGTTYKIIVEFWLAAVRDPSLRQVLLDSALDFGDVIDGKLAAAGTHPGLTGNELAVLMDALAVGLRMDQALNPDADQATLYAKALRKLFADEPEDA